MYLHSGLEQALQYLSREDPSLRVAVDDTGQVHW